MFQVCFSWFLQLTSYNRIRVPVEKLFQESQNYCESISWAWYRRFSFQSCVLWAFLPNEQDLMWLTRRLSMWAALFSFCSQELHLYISWHLTWLAGARASWLWIAESLQQPSMPCNALHPQLWQWQAEVQIHARAFLRHVLQREIGISTTLSEDMTQQIWSHVLVCFPSIDSLHSQAP